MRSTIAAVFMAVVLSLGLAGPAYAGAASPPSEASGDSRDAMAGSSGMMGSMGAHESSEMMGMAMHESAGAEAPWVTIAIENAQQLKLSADQLGKLQALRADFQKQAIRQSADIRIAELELAELLDSERVELGKVQAKVRQIEALRADLRFARIQTLEKGRAVLTEQQRQQLKQLVSGSAMSTGESMMGGGGMQPMHEFMRSDRMSRAMAGMMDMAGRMGGGDPMAGMVRMMEMMSGMGGTMGSGGMMPAPEAIR